LRIATSRHKGATLKHPGWKNGEAECPQTANSVNNLALLLWELGDLAAARPLYERALAIREMVSKSSQGC